MTYRRRDVQRDAYYSYEDDEKHGWFLTLGAVYVVWKVCPVVMEK